MIDVKTADRELQSYLRLQTFAVAIRMLKPDRDWAHWKGLYLHERKVVLSYSVGAMAVLEMPSLERRGSAAAFVRTLNLSPSAVENEAQLVFDPQRRAGLLDVNDLKPVASDIPAGRNLVVLSPKTSGTTATAASATLDEGLLGRWEFDEAGGTSASDNSGRGRTMQLNQVRRLATRATSGPRSNSMASITPRSRGLGISPRGRLSTSGAGMQPKR